MIFQILTLKVLERLKKSQENQLIFIKVIANDADDFRIKIAKDHQKNRWVVDSFLQLLKPSEESTSSH